MPADLSSLCDDLLAESASLESLLEPLGDVGWHTPTPAIGWDVLDQVTHLAFFDGRAALAATDPDEFRADAQRWRDDVGTMVEGVAARSRAMSGSEALAWLRRERGCFVTAVRPMDPSTRVPWYGQDMTVASSITSRIMETWAHGVDVRDALGAPLTVTARLDHVAFLGARAFANSYRVRGRTPPDAAMRIELDGANGAWVFGPADATDRVTGPLLDFCLVVTQRRHRDDTSLRADGAIADEWLSIAQAFAGEAGAGREPQATDTPNGHP
jgi:uncharacterized protein (TIGR03084 family)